MATNMATEDEKVVHLKGTPKNPGRDPKLPRAGKGSIGDVALTDSLIIVGAAWLTLVLLAYSLRHHNV